MARACPCAADWRAVALCAGLALLGLLALLAPDWLLSVAPPCLISLLTGHECWGCGLTRAVLAALHGNFAAAWALNPRVFVVLPLAAALAARFAWRTLQGLRSR